MEWFRNLWDVSGRIGRATFLKIVVGALVPGGIMWGVLLALFNIFPNPTPEVQLLGQTLAALGLVVVLPAGIVQLIAMAKRAHDLDPTGNLAWLGWIPWVNLGSEGSNTYGASRGVETQSGEIESG